ncbi:MAG TPA: FG-GAP-like repeat-containing protein, partial [Bryobacteraceae bacterium]|nr:FG-GAP-like repeat-containing protein [Bryobacteraceae bacterium]
VFSGNGDGTFRPIVPFAHAVSATPIRSGDFNGDGRADLLFGGIPSEIAFGNGDGTFGAPVSVTACSGTAAGAVADLNRDGKSDLMCGMTPLLSNGDGTFRGMPVVGDQAMESVQLIADVNGDGIPDVVIRQISSRLAVALGHGDGTFADEIDSNYTQNPQQSPAVLAGDFNGDGKIDLVTFSLHGNVAGDAIELLPGNGDGTFGAVVRTDLSASPSRVDVTLAGDFNHDGKLDLVAGNALYEGKGDGTFQFPVFFEPVAAVSADFNGDSLPDIVAYDLEAAGESIDLLGNDSPGDGFWTAGVSSATGAWPVAAGSFVSAYGVNLASKTEIATDNPLPTTLGGIRVHLHGNVVANDQLAPLLYVSPTQINYLLTSSDPVTFVDIEHVGTPWTQHAIVVNVVPMAPGFFDVGYSAAAGGYLTMYGTGYASAVTAGSACYFGSAQTPGAVTYAGPQPTIAGLDQVNILLPGSLAGAGVQPVFCQFADATGVQTPSKTIDVTIH